jgi:threonine synthase
MEPDVPMLVLETALPAKFADTIVEAIGLPPPRPSRVAGIEDLPQRVEVIDADVERVKQIIRAIYGN